MKFIKKIVSKINPPKKEENEIFTSWFSFASEELKEELNKLSSREVNKRFSTHLSFRESALRAPIGLASNKWNEITFDRVIRSISKYADSKGWKIVMLGVSDIESKDYYIKLTSKLIEMGYEVKNFRTPEVLLPELSYTISKRNYDFGIYLDWNKSNMEIRVLGEKGRFLKRTEAEDLSKILNDTQYRDVEQSDNIDKIQFIDDNDRIHFENLIRDNMKTISGGVIEKQNSLIINTTSKLMYQKMNDIFEGQEWVYVHLANKSKKESSYNVSEVTSFRESYFKSKRKKARFIINIDGSGSKMSLAYKHNKTWKYESVGKTMLLVLNRLKEMNLLKEADTITSTLNSSPIISDFAKSNKLDISIKEDAFASLNNESNYRVDLDYNISVTPEITSPDALIPTMLLISYLVNQQEEVSFTKKLNSINYKSHYTRREIIVKTLVDYKDDLKHIKKTKKIGDVEVKSINVIISDEKVTWIKIVVNNGYIIQRYSHVNESLESVYHIWSADQEDAFERRKKLFGEHKSILKQEYKVDDSKVSAKTIISMIIGTAFFILIIGIIFSGLFDPESIKNAFQTIGEKANTPYPYLLLLIYPIQRFLMPFLYKVIFKQTGVEVDYWSIWIGTMLGAFVSRVGISFIMGPGMLIWYLGRRGYNRSRLTSGILIQTIVMALFGAIFNAYFTGVGMPWMMSMPNQEINSISSHSATMLGLAGWLFLLFNMCMQVWLSMSKKFHNFINYWIELSLFIVKKERNYRNIHESMTFNFMRVRNTFRDVLKDNPKKLGKIFSVWFSLLILGSFETTFALNTVANTPMNNYWQTMTVGVLISNANEFFGIVPGGNGTTEWTTLAFTKGIVGGNLENFGLIHLVNQPEALDAAITDKAQQVAFLDRFNIYIKTAVSGIFFTVFTIKYNVDRFRK